MSEQTRENPQRRDQDLSQLANQGKRSLERALGNLPEDFGGWRKLIEEATEQFRQVIGDKSSVAIIGPANAGKSTLYNQLIEKGQQRAEVSAVPGTTREAQRADAGLFSVIDTPGADAVGEVGMEERRRALAAAEEADVLVLLFDASHGIRPPEQDLMNEIDRLQKPTVVAINKMDLVPKRERDQVVQQAAEALGLSLEKALPISAKGAEGLGDLLVGVALVEPGILAALGSALPAYRWRLTQSAIARAASSAGVIAVTPLPFIDFLPLVGVQAAMVLSIARIYDYKLTLGRARELMATFGAGLLGRTLFYELSKFGGPPGWLVAAGVAVGTTSALGYAAALWFERGTKLSGEALNKIGKAVSQTVVDRLRDIGGKRPGRQSLRERIDSVLEETAGENLDYPDY
ncbi:MAG: GTPase [Anaerolineales bacterium]